MHARRPDLSGKAYRTDRAYSYWPPRKASQSLLSRGNVLPDDEARSRAGRKMATDKGPGKRYRSPIHTPAGNHSVGVVFRLGNIYLLDANRGVYRHSAIAASRPRFGIRFVGADGGTR